MESCDNPEKTNEVAPVLLFLGYSIYMSIMLDSYVTCFGGVTSPLGYISNIPFMVSATLGIALAAAFVYINRKNNPRPLTLPYLLPAGIIALGYVLTHLFGPGPTAMSALLGLLWGASTSVLTAGFMEMIASGGSPTLIILQLASGTFLSGVLRMAIEDASRGAGLTVRLMLIAVFCAAIFVVRSSSTCAAETLNRIQAAPAIRLASTPIVAYVFYDAAIGLLNIYSYFSGETFFATASSAPMWGMLICAGLLIGFVVLLNRVDKPEMMTLVVFPLSIGVLMLLPILNGESGSWLGTLLYGANTFTSTMSMYCCITACKDTNSDVCLVTVLVRFVARLLLMAGFAAGYLFARIPGGEPAVRGFMVVAVCVYLLLVVIVYSAVRAAKQAGNLRDDEAASSYAAGTGATLSNSQTRPTYEETTRAKMAKLSTQFSLSPREQEVYALLLQGGTAKSIAERLSLSPNTVQGHIQNLYGKLGVNKKDQAIGLFDKMK